ncbi:MAG: DUF58 domain-containing protein [Gemmatimonadales bacterium]
MSSAGVPAKSRSRSRNSSGRGTGGAWQGAARRVHAGLAHVWRQLRAWRRIYFTAFGLAFTLGTVAVGFAAMNTANNLLYLLLGSMIGFMTVSSWLSEQAIRDVTIERKPPRSVAVGQDLRLQYEVTNRKRFLPSLALEIVETGLPNRAFVAHVAAKKGASARSVNSFVRRGIYPLRTVTISTSFPFGLFRKERDVEIPAEIVVWPRTDRPVREPRTGGGRAPRVGRTARGAPGARGEYRSLRGYRPGDDPRDIHWRSSARSPNPVVREYDADGAETRWICLDTRDDPGEAAEVAVEVAAALLAGAAAAQRPFALAAGTMVLEPGHGPGHLERALDILARVDFSSADAAPALPVPPSACVLVAVRPRAPLDGWGDVFAVGTEAKLASGATPVAA